MSSGFMKPKFLVSSKDITVPCFRGVDEECRIVEVAQVGTCLCDIEVMFRSLDADEMVLTMNRLDMMANKLTL